MPEFLSATFMGDPAVNPLHVLIHLVVAAVLGGVVAWIYQRTRSESEQTVSFPPTLVLLTILISVVTQVVGTNTARAFSLVGTLSIVRFRTVVRDTQDTAFVIFAVVVGMAIGASQLAVALLSIAVIGAVTFMMRTRRTTGTDAASFQLQVRVALGTDVDTVVRPTLSEHLIEYRLLTIGTAKQGSAIEVTYDARFRKNSTPNALVKALNRLEGVQNVELTTRPETVDAD